MASSSNLEMLSAINCGGGVATRIFFNHIIPHDRIVEFIPLNSVEFWMDPFKFDRLAKFKTVSYCA